MSENSLLVESCPTNGHSNGSSLSNGDGKKNGQANGNGNCGNGEKNGAAETAEHQTKNGNGTK